MRQLPPKPEPITPRILLRAYAAGLFPMAESRRGDRLYWLDPEQRGVLPLDALVVTRSLRRSLRRYEVRVDTAFADVVAIELVTGARAMALRSPLRASAPTSAVIDRVNALTGGPGHDRWLSPEIAAVGELVRSGEVAALVQRFVTLR